MSRGGRVAIGLIITPAIGFVVFRLALWGGLLAISIGFLAVDREVEEYPQIILWLDLFSTLCAAGAMFFTIRIISKWGNSPPDFEPIDSATHDRSGKPEGREEIQESLESD